MKKHVVIIVSGFSIIILLMCLVVLYNLSQNKVIHQTLLEIDLQNQKASLLAKMSGAQLERTVLLRNIYMLDDPFQRDELKLVFYSYARKVGDAFEKLQNMKLSVNEKTALDGFIKPARENSILQNRLIDKMIEEGDDIDIDELNELFHQSFQLEKKTMSYLHGMQESLDQLRKTSVDVTIISGEKAYHYIILFLIVTILFSVITIYYVINLTTRQTKQIDDERMRFKLLFSENMDAVLLLSGEKIIDWNLQLETFFNQRDVQNFKGNDIYHIMIPNQQDDPYSRYVLQERIKQATEQGSTCFEWQFVENKVTTLYADIQLNHLILNDGDMMQMTIHDITKIKRSKDVLRQRTKELEEINLKYKELSETDPLTKIPNRRAYEMRLIHCIATSKRSSSLLSMLMIDIDYFKLYNDHYGHDAGDKALIEVAKVIVNSLPRTTDFAARIGGEEFAVLLPATDQEGAQLIAERIRTLIEELAIEHSSSECMGVVTVSIGISVIGGDTLNTTDLIKQADTALYKAKEAGRNRFESYK